MAGTAILATVDVALVFAVDSSGSISNERMTMQIEGYARAVESADFVAAVARLPQQRIALAYVAWSNVDRQQYLVPWMVVDGAASAAQFAATLRGAVRPGAGHTSISGAIDFCVAELLRAAPKASRRIIDLSGDGRNNDGRPAREARDAAIAAGITINGLPILEVEANLDRYFADNVVGGPDAFMVIAEDETSLAAAIRRKLLTEVA